MHIYFLAHVLDKYHLAQVNGKFKRTFEAWVSHFGRDHAIRYVLPANPVPCELLRVNDETIPFCLLKDQAIVRGKSVRWQLIRIPLSDLEIVTKELLEAKYFTTRQVRCLQVLLPFND